MNCISDILSEFSPITAKQWKQKIQYLLQGQDYNQHCIWKSFEELSVSPFYNNETANPIGFFCQQTTQIAPNSYHNLYDPIGNLSKTGNFFHNKKEDFGQWDIFFKENRIIYVDTSVFSDAGASKIQQIAYALSVLLEYFRNVNSCDKAPVEVVLQVSQQPDFYLEVAKIRALRWVFQSIFKDNPSVHLQIIAGISPRFISFFKEDEQNNYYQSLWAMYSGIFGGANWVTFADNRYIIEKEKIAYLVQKMLQEYDTQWINNNFFIDNITFQIAQKALTLLKNIEASGGYLSQLKKHIIQRKIKEKALVAQAQFDKDYTHQGKVLQEEASEFFRSKNSKKTLLEPIFQRRYTEKYELQIFKK